MQAMLVVFEGFPPGLGGLTALLQFLLGAKAPIGMARGDELLRIGQVQGLALALDIGTVIPADIRAFIPIHAHVLQGAVDQLRGPFHKAALVRVLDAQQKLTPVLAGEQVSIQAAAQVADMHIPRGRGGETGTYLTHGSPQFILKLSFRPTIRLNTGFSGL